MAIKGRVLCTMDDAQSDRYRYLRFRFIVIIFSGFDGCLLAYLLQFNNGSLPDINASDNFH